MTPAQIEADAYRRILRNTEAECLRKFKALGGHVTDDGRPFIHGGHPSAGDPLVTTLAILRSLPRKLDSEWAVRLLTAGVQMERAGLAWLLRERRSKGGKNRAKQVREARKPLVEEIKAAIRRERDKHPKTSQRRLIGYVQDGAMDDAGVVREGWSESNIRAIMNNCAKC